MSKRKDWLERPTSCDNCGHGEVHLVNNCVLYGRNYGEWPLIWFCRKCRASVACHMDTDRPMGYMATKETRQARSRAHKAFDKIWKKGKLSRTKCYSWLAQAMNLEPKNCHISHFNIEQCNMVVELSKKKMSALKKKPRTFTHLKGRPVSKAGQRRRRT